MSNPQTILVTGGAGYVGTELVPLLLERGHRVRVIDLFLYGDRVLDDVKEKHPGLDLVKGDIRDQELLRRVMKGVDTVMHLACISNDPSFELDPGLSKSINFDCFKPMVRIAKESGVRRFIYISTSSVYGVSEDPNVTEDHPLVPLTDYNKYKGMCEPLLLEEQSANFTTLIFRPATVCGMSRRLRLDLSVNILTNHAVTNGVIKVFGGTQKRPNIHIQDVCDLYADAVDLPDAKIAGKTYNWGHDNCSILDLGKRVQSVVQREFPEKAPIRIETVPTSDIRSYQISSERIKRELGYVPKRTVEDAVTDLCRSFREGRIPNSMDDVRYYNVKAMKGMRLS